MALIDVSEHKNVVLREDDVAGYSYSRTDCCQNRNRNMTVTTLKDELKQRDDQCGRLDHDRSQLSLQLEAAEVGPE